MMPTDVLETKCEATAEIIQIKLDQIQGFNGVNVSENEFLAI